MSARYTIGEFSELSGVPKKTLRYYDEINLLRPSFVDPLTAYRYYDSGQLKRIALIMRSGTWGCLWRKSARSYRSTRATKNVLLR